MTCVLLGTPAIALPSAEVLRSSAACRLMGVVTQPAAPTGRQRKLSDPPLAEWAREHRIPIHQPATKQELTQALRELAPDVAIVVAYGRIIPKEALEIPRFGFVNLHPSLLPRWRGPSPIQAAIAAGDRETGVTLMLLDRQVDHGPIIAQERVALSPTTTRSALEQELATRGAQLLAHALPEYLAGRLTPAPQDHAQATNAKLLTRAHGRIDWQEPAAAIERKVRAYEGWPGTWCLLPDGKRLKVLQASVGDQTDASPGAVAASWNREAPFSFSHENEKGAVSHDASMYVACGDGHLLALDIVQPEGGTRMDGATFLRGHQSITRLT